MSAITALSTASLSPTSLPAASGAKGAHSSALTSSGGSSSSASGDTTSIATNADGSLSITTTNAKGQIVSSSTLQSAGASNTPTTNPLNMLV